MWKKLGAALMGAVLLGAAAGCTPTSTPSTSSSTTTTSVSSSGPREAYIPTEAFEDPFGGGGDLTIDSANYPAGTALTARVQIAGGNLGVPVGSRFGVCVSLQTLGSGLPVGEEVCVTAFVVEAPPFGGGLLSPTPVFDRSTTDPGVRAAVTGPLPQGVNSYKVRVRPADGFTCSGSCDLAAVTKWVRVSW